jgi:hypothetical protein
MLTKYLSTEKLIKGSVIILILDRENRKNHMVICSLKMFVCCTLISAITFERSRPQHLMYSFLE